MRNIEIEKYTGDYYIPAVSFNAESGTCEIEGESLLEDTIGFYNPLLDWLREYTSAGKEPITFNFKLTYFNTSSSKRILDILYILKDYEKKGGGVTVNWFLDSDSELVEDVEDFKFVSKLNINIIER